MFEVKLVDWEAIEAAQEAEAKNPTPEVKPAETKVETPEVKAPETTPKAEEPKAELTLQDVLAKVNSLQSLVETKATQEAEVAAVDLGERPEPLLDMDGYLDWRDAQKVAAQKAHAASVSKAQAVITGIHSDAEAIFASPEFSEFSKNDPVAKTLLAQAQANKDGLVAASVVSLFKAQVAAKGTTSVAQNRNAEALEEAQAQSIAGAGNTSVNPVTFTYKEIESMSEDERDRRDPEIQAAFLAGRVQK